MGKFVVRNTNTGIKFDLLATNGEVIATSEVYKSRKSCLAGIRSVQKNAVAANIEDQTVEGFVSLSHPKFEIFLDEGGKFRFHLKAVNGQIIAISKAYEEKAACLACVEAVKAAAPEAPIVKE